MPDPETLKEVEDEQTAVHLRQAYESLHAAVGAVEASYVMQHGGWTPHDRNVDCRLMLERVLYARKHPDAPKPPPLVVAAAEYAQNRKFETLRRLEEMVTSEVAALVAEVGSALSDPSSTEERGYQEEKGEGESDA